MVLSIAEYEEWVELTAPPDPGSIVVLKLAIDETGTHGGSPLLCVAACAGRPEHWKQFVRDWQPTATHYEQFGGYHATNAREDDNARLAAIVTRWLAGCAYTFRYDDFDAVIPHKIRSYYGAHYVTALRLVWLSYIDLLERREERWMTWVLEAGHREQASADKFLSEAVQIRRFRLYSYAWVGKEDITTHSADIVAHVVATAADPHPHPLLDVIRASAINIRHLTRDELAESVRGGMQAISDARWERTKRRREGQ